MKQVKAFQTSDGKVFTNELEAINREFAIECRAVVQSASMTNIDTKDFGSMIASNYEKIAAVINKYRAKINGYNKRISVTMASKLAQTKPVTFKSLKDICS